MYTALVILILLIDASPAVLVIGGPLAPGIVSAVTAIAVAVIAFTLRRSESADLRRFCVPLAIAAGLPIGWILVQMLPVKLPWAHPVWQSAAAALGTPIVGSFSIDRGLTLVALNRYVGAVAIMFVAAAVAVDRHRAKWILTALTGATTLIAIVVAVQHLTGVQLFSDTDGRASHDAALDGIALGAVLCAAAAAYVLDGSKSLRSKPDVEPSRVLPLTSSLAAFVICVLVLACFGSAHALFAFAIGLAIFLAIGASRRFALSPWGIAGILSMMFLVGSSIIATQPRIYAADPTLALADAPKSLVSVTERILADGTWTGSGAGTFGALVPIYKDPDELVDRRAPTTAAALVVELGRPALLVIVAIAMFGVVLLFRSGLARRRDWFYPAAGASCLLTAVLLVFSNIGFSSTPGLMILASSIGMAFGQSQRRAPPHVSKPKNDAGASTRKRHLAA